MNLTGKPIIFTPCQMQFPITMTITQKRCACDRDEFRNGSTVFYASAVLSTVIGIVESVCLSLRPSLCCIMSRKRATITRFSLNNGPKTLVFCDVKMLQKFRVSASARQFATGTLGKFLEKNMFMQASGRQFAAVKAHWLIAQQNHSCQLNSAV